MADSTLAWCYTKTFRSKYYDIVSLTEADSNNVIRREWHAAIWNSKIVLTRNRPVMLTTELQLFLNFDVRYVTELWVEILAYYIAYRS